jgi:SAM-dependent methyltransferase
VLVRACGIASGRRVLDVAAGTGNVAIRAAFEGASVVASDLTPEHFIAGRRGAAKAGLTVEWIEGDAEARPFDDGSFDVVTSCLGAMFAPHHERVADELLRVGRPNGTIGLINFTLFMDDFGPVIAIRANLAGAPERLPAFDAPSGMPSRDGTWPDHLSRRGCIRVSAHRRSQFVRFGSERSICWPSQPTSRPARLYLVSRSHLPRGIRSQMTGRSAAGLRPSSRSSSRTADVLSFAWLGGRLRGGAV